MPNCENCGRELLYGRRCVDGDPGCKLDVVLRDRIHAAICRYQGDTEPGLADAVAAALKPSSVPGVEWFEKFLKDHIDRCGFVGLGQFAQFAELIHTALLAHASGAEARGEGESRE